MSGIMLATVLTAGLSAQTWYGDGGATNRALEELKRAVEHLRKEQHQQRVEDLKQKASELRSEKLEQKLDELRRDVRGFHGLPPHHLPGWHHAHPGWMPPADRGPPNRALVRVSLPPGATLLANDVEVAVPPPGTPLLTPELEPGKAYHYDFRVRVSRDGQVVTKTKRVAVSAGSVARLAYEDMTAEKP